MNLDQDLGRLSDQAYARLTGDVLDGRLEPGSFVQEAELVRDFGMSRTPIREALRRLEGDGLIAMVPQRGYKVVELTTDEISDTYEVRGVLEALAAKLAATKSSRMDIARLEDLWDDMADAWERGSDYELAELNGAFHDAIAQASHNSYLESDLERIRKTVQRYRPATLHHQGRRKEAHEEHRAMLDAIVAGDSENAAELALRHVERAGDFRLTQAGQE